MNLSNDSSNIGQNKLWKRILYERQPFRDDYYDPEKFFDQLELKTQSKEDISFVSIVTGVSMVAQQLTLVTIFFAVYKLSKNEGSIFSIINVLNLLLLILGFCFHLYFDGGNLKIISTLQNTLLFGIYLRVAAPILHTLTHSFSGDTIHALAITFSTIHLVSYDYNLKGKNDQKENRSAGILSLNAAMFTAIILASRLKNIETVASFLLLAILLFVLFPEVGRKIKSYSINLHLILTFSKWLIASVLLYFLDKTLFYVYQILMCILCFVGPLLFVNMLSYKKAFRGPWDIAEIY